MTNCDTFRAVGSGGPYVPPQELSDIPTSPSKESAAFTQEASGTHDIISRDATECQLEGARGVVVRFNIAPDSSPAQTDLGNAERLIRHFGHVLRWHVEARKWLVWDGKRWSDGEHEVTQAAQQTVRWIYIEVSRTECSSTREQLGKWAKRSEDTARITGMIKQARSLPGVQVRSSQLDSDPWALNTQTGIVDLRTGDISDHDPARLMTRISPVGYDPLADTPPVLDRFLKETFAHDPSLIEHVQTLLGIGATGDATCQKLVIFHGDGRNGKSTLVDLVLSVLGKDGYAAKGPDGLLIASKGAKHAAMGWDLCGRRMVVCSEVAEDAALDEQAVKELTGDTSFKARPLYGQFVDVSREFLAVMVCNHLPRVRGSDLGIWRRLHPIPFFTTVSEADEDPGLLDKLRAEAEAGATLAWIVRGAVKFFEAGRAIETPPIVAESLREYQEAPDSAEVFVRDVCSRNPLSKVSSADLYAAHCHWAMSTGQKPASKKALAQCVQRHGATPFRSTKERGYCGISLPEQDN